MHSLLAPGPWHVTADDNIVRDANGEPVAVILARHPRAHADMISDLPNAVRRHDAARDRLIDELREKLATYEGIEAELDVLRAGAEVALRAGAEAAPHDRY